MIFFLQFSCHVLKWRRNTLLSCRINRSITKLLTLLTLSSLCHTNRRCVPVTLLVPCTLTTEPPLCMANNANKVETCFRFPHSLAAWTSSLLLWKLRMLQASGWSTWRARFVAQMRQFLERWNGESRFLFCVSPKWELGLKWSGIEIVINFFYQKLHYTLI